MGCYLSCLEVTKDGKLVDRLTGKYVEHEELPTLPEWIAKKLKYKQKSRKEVLNEKKQKQLDY